MFKALITEFPLSDVPKERTVTEEKIRKYTYTKDEVDELISLDEKRKSSIHNFETKKSEQKKASQEFGAAKKKGLASDDLLVKMQSLSKDVKDLEVVAQEAQEEI